MLRIGVKFLSTSRRYRRGLLICSNQTVDKLRYLHDIPETLLAVENERNPTLCKMVGYYFHKAVAICECDMTKELTHYRPKLKKEHVVLMAEGIISKIGKCERKLETCFPVRLDNDSYDIIKGFRVHFNTARDPVIGGIRFLPTLQLDDVVAMAAITSFGCALIKLPFGGAMGGIKIDPECYSDHELEHITRRYALELSTRGFLGPSIDILNPELKTGSQEMAWIADEYSKGLGYADLHHHACATGKPSHQGGLDGYVKAAGHGVFLAIDNFLQEKSWMDVLCLETGWKCKTVIVQGFGKLAQHACIKAVKRGAILVGVQMEGHGLIDKKGIDPEALAKHLKNKGTVLGFGCAQEVNNDCVILEKCDILILAAVEKLVHCGNAPKIRAKIIAEGAKGPITPSADKILQEKKVLILPDIYCSAGGLTASYLEWLKCINHVAFGRTHYKFEKDTNYHLFDSIETSLKKGNVDVKLCPSKKFLKRVSGASERDLLKSGLEHTMEKTAIQLMKIAQKHNLCLDLCTAAYILAVKRLFKTYMISGLQC